MNAVIKFNQKACLKPGIDMNAKLRKKAKNYFEKFFLVDEQCCFWKN